MRPIEPRLAPHADAARLGPLVQEAAKRGTSLGRALPLEEAAQLARQDTDLELAKMIGRPVHGITFEAVPQAAAFVFAIKRAVAARLRNAPPRRP
jgi:hypothetical protein